MIGVLAEDNTVDVVLLDLVLPDQTGVEAAERMTAMHPRAAVVVLTTPSTAQYRLHRLRSGRDRMATRRATSAYHLIYGA